MDQIYLIALFILLLLAISDLVVGVSNDAVNFLVSAIGSKAGSFRTVMIIASLGVLIGATFSEGMMEVARKGIFHPEKFYFNEIMIIFVAVMLTDIILLDLFNTFGLPTSTTVSIVFELLGGAVMVAIYKLEPGQLLGDYINTSKAVEIITGILISVVIAFTVGSLIQYLSRLLFSFKYQRSVKWFGAIWGGMAITAITYFILVKGAKGSSLISHEQADWIKSHSIDIVLYSFVAWAIVMQILQWFKVNILKLIVLVGTFGLAMAFAGNDLVNFIGVPLAALKSFEAFSVSGVPATEFSMAILGEKVQTPTLYLLIAGLVMVITLWVSKKARTVTETSINLSRQSESGEEQFDSSYISRAIVRMSISFSSAISSVVPAPVRRFLNSRLQRPEEASQAGTDGAAAFDLIRASVNLAVSSILISVGTSLKLPLSTTYVTFMVAMGTSLADGAWGRSTAVYRITGVLSVITGWFVTALVAFTVAGVFATLMFKIGMWMMFVILALVLLAVWRLRHVHKQREAEAEEMHEEEAELVITEEMPEGDVFQKCIQSVVKTLRNMDEIYDSIVEGLDTEDMKTMKDATKTYKKLNKRSKRLKDNIEVTVKALEAEKVDTAYYYVQVVDYLREISHAMEHVVKPSASHVDNNHRRLSNDQILELHELRLQVNTFVTLIADMVKTSKFDHIDEAIARQTTFLQKIKEYRLNHFARIKRDEAGPKNSLLYLNILTETQNILLFTVNLLKSQRDFVVKPRSK